MQRSGASGTGTAADALCSCAGWPSHAHSSGELPFEAAVSAQRQAETLAACLCTPYLLHHDMAERLTKRCLRRQPRLLICDEATSALDSATEASIMASLQARAALLSC